MSKIRTLSLTSAFRKLHERQETDQHIYDLHTVLPKGALLEEGALHHTSEIPKIYGDKVVAILSQHDITVKTPQTPYQELRAANRDLELFLRGMLRDINEEQTRLSNPDLISQLSYQIAMRGWGVGRVLLNRVPESGRLFPDVLVWDAMRSVWQMDGRGIKWMATSKLIPIDVGALAQGSLANQIGQAQGNNAIVCWEYIDRENYCVVTDRAPSFNVNTSETGALFVVEPVPHGVVNSDNTPTCPGFVIAAGARTPMSVNEGSNESNFDQIGESIFAAARNPIAKLNYIESLWTQKAIDSANPKYQVASEGGEKGLIDDVADAEVKVVETRPETQISRINEDGSRLNDLLEQYRVALDDVIRSTLPDLLYGDPNRTFSGFALSQLDRNAQQKILPFLSSLSVTVAKILTLTKEQFQQVPRAMPVIGALGYNGSAVQKDIDSFTIRQASRFEIDLVPKNLQVAPEILNQAISAVNSGIMSREQALRLMGVPNPQYELDRIRSEQLEANHPILALYETMRALANNGKQEQAQFIRSELEQLYFSQQEASYVQRASNQLYIRQLVAALAAGDEYAAGIIIRDMSVLGIAGFGPTNVPTPSPLSPFGNTPPAPNSVNRTSSDTAYGTRVQEGAATAEQNTQNARQPRQGG